MGTRADFYAGKGAEAEWLGSIAWDGDRDGIPESILHAKDEAVFRAEVASFIAGREDGTKPEDGWPWPWDDSGTTDCHYWHFDGRTWEGRGEDRRYGEVYVPADEPEPDWDSGEEDELYAAWLGNREKVVFPNMSARKSVTMGKRSGVIMVGFR